MPRSKIYVGAAGEFRAGSELSLRGYVVHLPVVDEGGDLWTVVEDSGVAARIQVKTSASRNRTKWSNHIAHQINIKAALLQPGQQVNFVVHCIHDRSWHTLVMSRDELVALLPGALPGAGRTKTVWFVFSQTGDILIGGTGGPSARTYLDSWDSHFPLIDPTGANP
jgi:hypothetical protein